jgi:sulfite reductase alpha subunit-like flavoprotein
MGADVQAALVAVVAARIGGGEDAAAYVANLKARGRYVQELWA